MIVPEFVDYNLLLHQVCPVKVSYVLFCFCHLAYSINFVEYMQL